MNDLIENCGLLFEKLNDMELSERVETINQLRMMISEHSPFASEPVPLLSIGPRLLVISAHDQSGLFFPVQPA